MAPRLSVLDLSPIPSGSTATETLRSTIALAQHAEALGYQRVWVAEHHNAGGLASSSPEILIGQIAAATRVIRVGAGGIMLPNHAPLKVAESFRVLHALFPGRIDLGIGRAAGTDPRTALALRRGGKATADDFPALLDELLAYLDDDAGPRARFAPTIRAAPLGVPPPEIWILGSSDVGGAIAAERGLAFAFAHHQNPDDAVAALRRYRADFRPSPRAPTARSIVAASVICAPTDDEAEALASSGDLSMLRFGQGVRDLPLPSVAEALAYAYDEDEEALRRAYRGRHVIGGVARVREALLALLEASQADELMVMTNVHDPAARRRSYALVAEALGVAPRTA